MTMGQSTHVTPTMNISIILACTKSDSIKTNVPEATITQRIYNIAPLIACITTTGTSKSAIRSQVTSKRAITVTIKPKKIKTRSSRDMTVEADCDKLKRGEKNCSGLSQYLAIVWN